MAEQDQIVQEAPRAEPNPERHEENIKKLIKEVQSKIKVCSIEIDQLESPNPDELHLKKNFPCLMCKKMPIAPV